MDGLRPLQALPREWLVELERTEGSGTAESETFTLRDARPVGVRGVYEGTGAFTARLLNNDTGRPIQLFDQSGTFRGSNLLVQAVRGEHLIRVDASGDWRFTVWKPVVPSEVGVAPVVDVSGTDTTALGVVQLDGQTTVTGGHDADGEFSVFLYPVGATDPLAARSLFDTEGAGERQTSVDASGQFWVVVRTSGDWRIRME